MAPAGCRRSKAARHRSSRPAVTLAITADASGLDGLASAFVGTVGWSDPAHLATFPEQNPNAVIETDMSGTITYCNPEAVRRFPDLAERGIAHPLVAGALDLVEQFRSDGHEFAQREVEFGDAVFEQKVCYSPHPDGDLIRIFTAINSSVTRDRFHSYLIPSLTGNQ